MSSLLLTLNKILCLQLIKKETLQQVFSCEFCEISKNTFSYRTPPVAASGTCNWCAAEGIISLCWRWIFTGLLRHFQKHADVIYIFFLKLYLPTPSV